MFPFPEELQRLRLASLFPTSVQAPADDGSGDNSVNSIPYDVNQRLSELYQPQHGAMDAYVNTASGMPNRNDYHPSMLRQIGAAIAGMGAGAGPAGEAHGSLIGFRGNPQAAMDTADKFANEPYYKAMEDWQTHLQPLSAAAMREENENRNNRMLAEQTISRELLQQRQNETARTNTRKEAQKDEQLAIANKRAEAYTFDKLHPNYTRYAEPNGTLKFINPKDPSDVYDTGWESGKIDDRTKIDLGIKGRLDVVGAQGQNARDLETQREQDREKLRQIPPMRPTPSHTQSTTTLRDASGNVTGSRTIESGINPNDRVNVVGPPDENGKPRRGTVPKGTKLPNGWKIEE